MRQGILIIVNVVLRHANGIPVIVKILPCVGLETTGLTSAPAITVKMHFTILLEKLGHGVAQLIEALRYKTEGRGFDFQWGHWDFH
jgi:hypothetical protein